MTGAVPSLSYDPSSEKSGFTNGKRSSAGGHTEENEALASAYLVNKVSMMAIWSDLFVRDLCAPL